MLQLWQALHFHECMYIIYSGDDFQTYHSHILYQCAPALARMRRDRTPPTFAASFAAFQMVFQMVSA
jgi:hypothetical protein